MAEVAAYFSSQSECPPAAGIWVLNAGVITGEGESHYHWFPDYVCLHILSRGAGWVKTPLEMWELRAGDMFTLWPEVDIEYGKNPDDPWLVHFIHLTGPLAVAFGRECGFDHDRCRIQPESPVETVRDFQEIAQLLRFGDPPGSYAVQSILYRIIGHCRGVPKESGGQAETFEHLVKRARMLIEVKLDSGLNVNTLADMLRVGRTTLFQAFRRVLGVTPIDYLTRCRLERAKKLLLERRYPLARIARMAGYTEVRYFRKRFLLEEGILPSQWLEKQLHRGD